MKTEKAKVYIKSFLGAWVGFLFLWGLVVVVIDPFFHYHKPLPGISYRMYEERYINDGIGRHFDYDAIITGTSMTQNFKTTEFDALFGRTSVKMPFSGGGFLEIFENLRRSLRRHPECKTVLLALDYYGIIRAWDWQQYEGVPEYLYDEDPFNDVSYIYNKEVMYRGVLTNLLWTVTGNPGTTFDEYASWSADTGLDAIIQNGYERSKEIIPMIEGWTEEDIGLATGTIEKLILPLFREHPEVNFYVFYTPYSIVAFDEMYRNGRMKEQFLAEEMASQAILSCENVHLFEFFEDHEMIENLENYRDKEHYAANVNSRILEYISRGEHELKYESLPAHTAFMYDYYLNYDYDGIFE